MMNPRKMTEEEVRLLVLQMTQSLPSDVTIEAALPEFLDTIAALSDRATMEETATLLGMAMLLTKAVAAREFYAVDQIAVEKGTMQ